MPKPTCSPAPTWRRARWVCGAGVVAGLAAAIAASAPATAAGPRVGVQNLYHPGHDTVWAYMNYAVPARAAPRARARKVARLKLRTEDRTDELVLIRAQTRVRGQVWFKVELPIRPAGRTGWIPSWAVGEPHHTSRLVRIDTRRLRLTVVGGGRVLMAVPIGIGRPAAPTPHGSFYVRDRLVNSDPTGFYGPLAFGLSAKSAKLTDWPHGGVIGIHGTSLPKLIPGRPSHGCIRLRNADDLRFDRLVTVGVPVVIS